MSEQTDLIPVDELVDCIGEYLPDALKHTIRAFQNNTKNHSNGVSEFAEKLSRRLGLQEQQIELIKKGSLLHDIGKIRIPTELLDKPARYQPEEYELVKTHTIMGAALLEKCPKFLDLIPIIRHHHEFYNGKGYPDNIAGIEIALEIRIVTVADAVSAMSSDRPYRSKLSTKEIIAELKRCSGTQFDPLVANVAIRILEDADTMANQIYKM